MNRDQRHPAVPENPPDPVSAMLAAGKRHHAANRLAEAADMYRRVLETQPNRADVLHLWGVAEHLMHNPAQAASLIGRSLDRNPDNAAGHNDLGLALQDLGRFSDALASYDRVLELKPDHAGAYNNRGNTLRSLGRLEDAVESYDRSLTLQSGNAMIWSNRGNVLRDLTRFDEALASYDRAIALRPDSADLHNNRAVTLASLDRPDEAVQSYDLSLAISPDNPAVWRNRGNALRDLRRLDDALASFDRALSLDPDNAATHNNRGLTLKAFNRPKDAVESFDAALAIRPDYEDCRWNLSLCCLSMGDFERGWAAYACRAHIENPLVVDTETLYRKPLPEDLTGQHIAVVREQGLGDELFFLRFAPLLRQRGARVTYLAEPRLVAMLKRADIVNDVLPDNTGPGPFDLRITAGDLPYVLQQGQTTPPPPFAIPPLPGRRSALAAQLQNFAPPPYVGLTWRAGTTIAGLLHKEVPMADLATATDANSGTLAALQRKPETGEIAALEAAFGRPVLDLTALNDDLEDMLALMDLLDFYVCVSNTNLHLRAANGHKSHVLVPSPAEFRWMADGAESPWFPGTSIYRQAPDGDWSGALDQLAHDLDDG